MIEVHAKSVMEGLSDLEVLSACVLRLHLEDEVATAGIGIARVEHTGVGFEAASSLMPLAAIK